MRLLCVDDDSAMLEIEQLTLEAFGFQVITSASGHEALELFRSGGIDAVVTDLNMPEMNGMQLACEMKRVKPQVPILMYSAQVSAPEGAEHLVDAFVMKGTSPANLAAEIARLLRAPACDITQPRA